MNDTYPNRIVCLTDETVETLYLLEEDHRIVGVSAFCERPPRAREEKPVVTTFTKARIDDILALRPDLVLGFSDIQAEIAKQLISLGVEVHVFNHRTIDGILRMIRVLGGMIGCLERANQLAEELSASLDAIRNDHENSPRPRVYFEEWDDPIITGIGYVSELIQIAGGEDVFADHSGEPLAKHRMVHDATEVIRRDPDIILASWCGKPFRRETLVAREGWGEIAAVRNGEVHEIPSPIILQPGPALLTDGARELQKIFAAWKLQQAGVTV